MYIDASVAIHYIYYITYLGYMPLAFFFFFNDTATTEIYTLSLHDALPISPGAAGVRRSPPPVTTGYPGLVTELMDADRRSTRLNSSHLVISYAVFCLKKKKKQIIQ